MAAPAVAQRAACTGTLLEPDGTPVGAARVTFVQEVSQALGGTPDRIEVRSDEHGAFAAELLLGSPYVVWAIGPRDTNGAHLVTTATMQAAAGKRIELRANRRRAPRAISVRGVAPWVADAPPALRVLVGGQYACGPDVVLPGDGVVKLGPWPDDPIELALVDGEGQTLDFAMLVEGTPASVTFKPTRQFECLVVDQDGAPIAGAAIWTPAESQNWSHGNDPLPRCSVGRWRRAGVTDAHGEIAIRLPWPEKESACTFLVLASREGYAATTSGFFCGRRLVDSLGKMPDEVDRFEFTLERREPTRFRIDALPGGAATMAFAKTHLLRSTNGGGVIDLLVPVAFEGQDARPSNLELPDGLGGVGAYLRPRATAATAPTRLVAGWLGANAPPTVDVAALREHRLVFADEDDHPVPFVHVVVGVPTNGYPRRWYDRCVADAEGVVTLRAARTDWLVLATDGTRAWCERIWATGSGGTRRLIGGPVPMLSLRFVDVTGAGLAGVGVAADCWPRVEARIDADDWRRAGLAQLAGPLLRTARSDHDGNLLTPLPAGPVTEVVFRRGALEAKHFRLAVDVKFDPIVLQ